MALLKKMLKVVKESKDIYLIFRYEEAFGSLEEFNTNAPVMKRYKTQTLFNYFK
jgi:hypothetical protein